MMTLFELKPPPYHPWLLASALAISSMVACEEMAQQTGNEEPASSENSQTSPGEAESEEENSNASTAGPNVAIQVFLTRFQGHWGIDGERERQNCAATGNSLEATMIFLFDEESQQVEQVGFCVFDAKFEGDLVTATEAECRNVPGSFLGSLGITDRTVEHFSLHRKTGEMSAIFRDPESREPIGDYVDCLVVRGAQKDSPASQKEKFTYDLNYKASHQLRPLGSDLDCGRAVFVTDDESELTINQLTLSVDPENEKLVTIENFSCQVDLSSPAVSKQCVPLIKSDHVPRVWVDQLDFDDRSLLFAGHVKTDKVEQCVFAEGTLRTD